MLGEHVTQAGSLVAHDRLRFDFNHISAMSAAELAQVEDEVNRAIMEDLPVSAAEMAQKEAIAKGAMALFGEKYGDTVRVVSVGLADSQPESVELCGGTHLERTGQAGMFTLLSEAGIASGVRRIEAATGWNAIRLAKSRREELEQIAALVKGRPGELAPKVDALAKEVRSVRKELDKALAQAASGQGQSLFDQVVTIGSTRLLAASVDAPNIKALRELMDDVRSKLPSGIACLMAVQDDKVNAILYVSKDLHAKLTAPDLMRLVAPLIGGQGGGRPDQAQAGGTRPEGIAAALELCAAEVNKLFA